MQAHVSIILPVHNAEPWLDECLRSVLQQDFEGTMELSVFNDASKDKSGAIIEKWRVKLEDSGVHVIIGGHDSPSPRGVGYSKNQAVAQSSGSYLCFLDSGFRVESLSPDSRPRWGTGRVPRLPSSLGSCRVVVHMHRKPRGLPGTAPRPLNWGFRCGLCSVDTTAFIFMILVAPSCVSLWSDIFLMAGDDGLYLEVELPAPRARKRETCRHRHSCWLSSTQNSRGFTFLAGVKGASPRLDLHLLVMGYGEHRLLFLALWVSFSVKSVCIFLPISLYPLKPPELMESFKDTAKNFLFSLSHWHRPPASCVSSWVRSPAAQASPHDRNVLTGTQLTPGAGPGRPSGAVAEVPAQNRAAFSCPVSVISSTWNTLSPTLTLLFLIF
ncbi:UDP-GlcNAc:betaGal beta-1,3-N-acetylglucosaminyltransferase-like protein 1 isoform X1 [Trachypithecus francoisi]|uniref:UDP-GlcNAc:betaGal beta-1,3-N-acetylglucosaminyltransferase-like protein 1 isoform X1 n=1 Tax=Trachypithecus francoisi TaxID=54180 RepID=UPI00141B0A02|nr:UDP-GlcNAc:betaGal beta-1,3-N-acetylglucosaminyltransferase-like protein 1 isoform X1 [Trachypithecus francoisi]